MWNRVSDLTNRALGVSSDLELPRGDHWSALVTVGLSQANERLDSVRMLLDKGYWDSSVILTRSLFELATNLGYIAKDTSGRLTAYLGHGGVPLSEDQAEQLQKTITEETQPQVKDIVPGHAWLSLKEMCMDLDAGWVAEYETFYRYASVPTHSGAFTLGRNYSRLLSRDPPSDQEKATVLITALTFHLRVAQIAAITFPNQIDMSTIEALQGCCRSEGQNLASAQRGERTS